MFQNLLPSEAAIYSAIIAVPVLIVAIITHIKLNKFCRKNENAEDKKIIRKANIAKAIALLLFCVSGLFIGNLINITANFCTALSHGMSVNPETGEYDILYGEMLNYNRKSVKETDIDINDLKNKAIIYVRYDCPDCIALHSQLAEIKDMIFLASRSERGKAARDLYDIKLTEVPQGVYISTEGKATTISIVQHDENGIRLDLQQITILREMVNRHEQLSSE